MIKRLEFLGDNYKYSHKNMYSQNVDTIYTTLVPRATRYMDTFDNKVVAFGAHYIATELKEIAYEFFNRDISDAEFTKEYNKIIIGEKLITAEDWLNLKKLGYLPITLKAVPDGTIVPVQTPVLQVENTVKEFFWLGQYLETYISQTYWPLMTAATKARELRQVMSEISNGEFTKNDSWRLHDFGMRGHVGYEASILQGLGHLAYCNGSDNVAAQLTMKKLYPQYKVQPIVNATEHSVMCSHGEVGEIELFEQLLNDYHNTTLSVVIDGYDQDNFIKNIVPQFKDKILDRKIPLVLRPDSGDINVILPLYTEWLGETFGFTDGVLNGVMLLWGDGCTADNIRETLNICLNEGYSWKNYIFGVGSYYYQSSTRDTLNIAIKATCIKLDDGSYINTMKKIKSDTSKKSLSGLTIWDGTKTIQNVQDNLELFEKDARIIYFKGEK